MQSFVLHLWAPPNLRYPAPCPIGLEGNAAAASGFVDPASITANYNLVAFVSVAVVLAVIGWCYFASGSSTSRTFVMRWRLAAVASGLLAAVAAIVILRWVPVRAAATSCATDPTAFPFHLDWLTVLNRALAGFLWAAAAFAILSLLLTQTAGRVAAAGGLYHNRGVPWPRLKAGE